MDKILAVLAAASLKFCFAFITLNKEQVAGIVHAVDMCIGRFAALMTMSDDLFCNTFAQPLIEHKILSVKLIVESLFFYLVYIIDYSTL